MQTAGADWIQEVLVTFERPLLRFAVGIVGEVLAPDVVQDTFLRLIAQERSAVEGHLSAWLFTVCKNRAIELRRTRSRTEPLGEDDDMESPDANPESALERADSRRHLLELLDTLPERHREIVALKFGGGLSYKEIAAITNLTETNVGFILHTALKALKKKVADRGEQPAVRREGGDHERA